MHPGARTIMSQHQSSTPSTSRSSSPFPTSSRSTCTTPTSNSQPPSTSSVAYLSGPSSDSDGPRGSAILEGSLIEGFRIGGELRLCLPQLIYVVLREFNAEDINSECVRLHIYCSRCTPSQLKKLKMDGILPAATPSCGLITQSDAERLCAALLGRHHRASHGPRHLARLFKSTAGLDEAGEEVDLAVESGLHSVPIYHECFGRCYGTYYPALYKSEFAPCIECDECGRIMSPQRFVTHSHDETRHPSSTRGEHRTCHWGFESAKWRAYILLDQERSPSFSATIDAAKEVHSREHVSNLVVASAKSTSLPSATSPASASSKNPNNLTSSPNPNPSSISTSKTDTVEIKQEGGTKSKTEIYSNVRKRKLINSFIAEQKEEERNQSSSSRAAGHESSPQSDSPASIVTNERNQTNATSNENSNETTKSDQDQDGDERDLEARRRTTSERTVSADSQSDQKRKEQSDDLRPSTIKRSGYELLSEMKSRFQDSANTSSSSKKLALATKKPQAKDICESDDDEEELVKPVALDRSSDISRERNLSPLEEERSWERCSGLILKNIWKVLRSTGEFSGSQSSAVCLAVSILAENGLLGPLGTPLAGGILPHPTLSLDVVLIEAFKGLAAVAGGVLGGGLEPVGSGCAATQEAIALPKN